MIILDCSERGSETVSLSCTINTNISTWMDGVFCTRYEYGGIPCTSTKVHVPGKNGSLYVQCTVLFVPWGERSHNLGVHVQVELLRGGAAVWRPLRPPRHPTPSPAPSARR
jgi:hypothetical protein